jgi:hypothetical protein
MRHAHGLGLAQLPQTGVAPVTPCLLWEVRQHAGAVGSRRCTGNGLRIVAGVAGTVRPGSDEAAPARVTILCASSDRSEAPLSARQAYVLSSGLVMPSTTCVA